MNILISACLLGARCRYDGEGFALPEMNELKKYCTLIPICPEQMGGLPTPRVPAEIVGDAIINKEGVDVTYQYMTGAKTALTYAQLNNVQYALLKAKSPSCGKGKIYDGTFSGTLIDGSGITARLLEENGIKVYTENDIDELLQILLTNNNTSV